MSLADVQRQISALSDRETPEIIDVDLLDEVAHTGSEPPTRRRRVSESGRSAPVGREVITINDSDDDDIQFVSVRAAPRTRRGHIFSPSPPPQIASIPPVPQIPRRFLPMRRRPPPFPTVPGLVVPDAEPLPFEANIRRVPRPGENPPAPVYPPAAAPSHHVPAMGLGGALLQRVRATYEQPPPRSRSNEGRRRFFGIPADVFMQWNPLDFLMGEDEPHGDDGFRHYQAADFHDEPGDPLMRGDLRLFNNLGRPSEPDYKTEYTHPAKPTPGFTHDFELSTMTSVPVIDIDSPGSSSSSRPGDPVLVCPRCHDPLILGAADVGEDRAKRRLWGLRCGHLLDGKCVEELMKPPPLIVPGTIDVKGKGKGKAEYEDELPLPGAYPTRSIKGKGKATESDIFPEPEFTSIRSRLRPRHPPPSSSSSSSSGPGPSRARPRASHRSPLKGKGNGKGRAKGPSVDAEHEWTCPVGGCGRVHVSQLINGQWVMDEKRGAITVFV
ncbi:hypothetical protein AZE42_06604 [Rhizopogon vesiculosus]|uniref:Uncharacterized protein n=1 Tax=Rhizopogon vesiculosus TaxID=180088 RepID=A0A1J8QF17_9AGAM|nr:hypothetical protein AZE42_06604 [Rhizopogon vesiculosus]